MDIFCDEIAYVADVYLRLSKEDGDLKVGNYNQQSNSIINQKIIIQNYLKLIPNVKVNEVYIDDGYTGTNFNRPGYEKMIHDVRNGIVNMVIVKDLSRFGRDYVEAGRYIKKEFRMLGIRFVAVLDHFDSLTATSEDYNILLPVKNFLNDQSSGDLSYKIRGNQKAMRSEGKYIGPYVGFGRKKSEFDKHYIEIDKYAGEIIKDMVHDFYMGYTVKRISERLNERGVPSPADYKRTQGIDYKTPFQLSQKSKWSSKTVIRALSDKMNIGIMEQGKRKRINHKVRNVIETALDERDIVYNKVPALMSQDVYDNVQRLLLSDMRTAPGQDTVYLFSGLLYCGDCNHSMTRRKIQSGIQYICSTYNNTKGCTRHSINEDQLKAIVLSAIRSHMQVLMDVEKLIEHISGIDVKNNDIVRFDKELQNKNAELERYSKLQRRLYKDWVDEIISEEELAEFEKMYYDYCDEIRKIIQHLTYRNLKISEKVKENSKWLEKFKKHQNVDELSRIMLVILLDKIKIYENNQVEIIFRFQDRFWNSLEGGLIWQEQKIVP